MKDRMGLGPVMSLLIRGVLTVSCLLSAGCTERQRLSLSQNLRYYTGRSTYLGTIYPNKFDLTISRDEIGRASCRERV